MFSIGVLCGVVVLTLLAQQNRFDEVSNGLRPNLRDDLSETAKKNEPFRSYSRMVDYEQCEWIKQLLKEDNAIGTTTL